MTEGILLGLNANRLLRKLRVGHLTGHEPAPDQIVELGGGGVEIEFTRAPGDVGRSNRLVRFLRAGLGLVVVGLRGHERLTEILRNLAADCIQRNGGDIDAVRSHVGDETRFVELLRKGHRAVGREPAHARGGLLKGRRGERRVGMTRLRLDLHRNDAEHRSI